MKKDKGEIEYIFCLLALFIITLTTIILVNVASYQMRKEQVENFVTDSTLSGAVIDYPKFEMTGYINNYDIKKTYNNFTTCLKKNLKLGNTIQINNVITAFAGPQKDPVISDKTDALKITDYYIFNTRYDGEPNQENKTGKIEVIKLIENNIVNSDLSPKLYSENIDNTTITLSQTTGKNKVVPIHKNTLVIYVRLELKIKPFSVVSWGNKYSTKETTGIHEYLVDVAEKEVYRHEEENGDGESSGSDVNPPDIDNNEENNEPLKDAIVVKKDGNTLYEADTYDNLYNYFRNENYHNLNGVIELDNRGYKKNDVTDLSNLFSSFQSTTEINLSNFDMSNVTNMNDMFKYCNSLKKVTFNNTTSNVTSVKGMFQECDTNKLEISSFNTSNVTDMTNMFYGCKYLTELNLSSFNTSNVNNMDSMFFNCLRLTKLDMTNFNTSKVNNMKTMFYGCSSLTELDLSSFNTSKVTNMNGMFQYCSGLIKLNLSSFNTSELTTMSLMFSGCSNLTELNLSSFDTSNVTNMGATFSGCSSLTELDLSLFNTSNVKDMSYMFSGCSNLKTIYASDLWSILNVTSSEYMFYGCKKLVGAISYNSSKIDKFYANYQKGYFTYK